MKLNVEQSDSLDKQFVKMMIPLHQRAVELSKHYIKEGDHQKLIKIATKIISSRQDENAQFHQWLNTAN